MLAKYNFAVDNFYGRFTKTAENKFAFTNIMIKDRL